MKVLVESSCNSGTYVNHNGVKTYTTEFNVGLITVLDWTTKETKAEKKRHIF